jgi:hypothetical protein
MPQDSDPNKTPGAKSYRAGTGGGGQAARDTAAQRYGSATV